jgi:catechol 2,3-dioxygenase-like lactoylglutathione lyase family enzyme
VAIPVTDQTKSKALFEDLGLSATFDEELQPGFRWIELSFPEGDVPLALVPAEEGLSAGIDTGIRFFTPDARAAHELLGSKGLEVGELLDWETAPLMFSFLDLDGNRFYVTQDH